MFDIAWVVYNKGVFLVSSKYIFITNKLSYVILFSVEIKIFCYVSEETGNLNKITNQYNKLLQIYSK